MGWAKYMEDNNEMIFERLERMNDRRAVIEVTAVIHLPAYPVYPSRNITEGQPQTELKPKSEDKILHCKDCGDSFLFSVGEQNFYRRKDLSQPKRCKCCRAIEKIRRVAFR